MGTLSITVMTISQTILAGFFGSILIVSVLAMIAFIVMANRNKKREQQKIIK